MLPKGFPIALLKETPNFNFHVEARPRCPAGAVTTVVRGDPGGAAAIQLLRIVTVQLVVQL